jgi:hypothetical protein
MDSFLPVVKDGKVVPTYGEHLGKGVFKYDPLAQGKPDNKSRPKLAKGKQGKPDNKSRPKLAKGKQ